MDLPGLTSDVVLTSDLTPDVVYLHSLDSYQHELLECKNGLPIKSFYMIIKWFSSCTTKSHKSQLKYFRVRR